MNHLLNANLVYPVRWKFEYTSFTSKRPAFAKGLQAHERNLREGDPGDRKSATPGRTVCAKSRPETQPANVVSTFTADGQIACEPGI